MTIKNAYRMLTNLYPSLAVALLRRLKTNVERVVAKEPREKDRANGFSFGFSFLSPRIRGVFSRLKIYSALKTAPGFVRTAYSNIYIHLCRVSGIRPRYVLTRSNRLRLRYLAYVWLGVFIYSAVFAGGDLPLSPETSHSRAIAQTIAMPHLDPDIHDNREIRQNNDIAQNNTNRDVVMAALAPDTKPSDVRSKDSSIVFTKFDFTQNLHDVRFESYKSETVRHLENDFAEANRYALRDQKRQKAEKQQQKPAQGDVRLASLGHAIPYESYEMAGRNDDSYPEKYIVAGLPIPPRPLFAVNGDNGEVVSKSFEVQQGDTFAGILQKAGINRDQSPRIIAAVSREYNPRYLKVGQKIDFELQGDRTGTRGLSSLSMSLDGLRILQVRHTGRNDFSANIEKPVLNRELRARNMTIETSLYGSAAKQNIPRDVIEEVLRIYAWDVDFQRDLRKGDQLEILYEVLTGKDGRVMGYGAVEYASLAVKGRAMPVYRYKMKNGRHDYFTPKGRSVRKALMRTPIDGARISSRYGMRHHPILGYSKMHKGVDFAAPKGTPIYAAGDGVVERIGRYGAYGKYIRLRHNNRLQTAYAHLDGYKKGLKKGHEVKQGDVIGYLGNTGRSTGPHLHYEVLINGRQANPGALDLPTGTILAGESLRKFKRHMNRHRQHYAQYLDINGEKFALADTAGATTR